MLDDLAVEGDRLVVGEGSQLLAELMVGSQLVAQGSPVAEGDMEMAVEVGSPAALEPALVGDSQPQALEEEGLFEVVPKHRKIAHFTTVYHPNKLEFLDQLILRHYNKFTITCTLQFSHPYVVTMAFKLKGHGHATGRK